METLGFHENLVTFLVVHTLSPFFLVPWQIITYDIEMILIFRSMTMAIWKTHENTVLFDEKWQNQHPVLFKGKWSQLAYDSVVFVRTMNAEDERILHVFHGRLTFNKNIWLNHQPNYKSLMFHLRLCQRGLQFDPQHIIGQRQNNAASNQKGGYNQPNCECLVL